MGGKQARKLNSFFGTNNFTKTNLRRLTEVLIFMGCFVNQLRLFDRYGERSSKNVDVRCEEVYVGVIGYMWNIVM
jgi:hypothetical protein